MEWNGTILVFLTIAIFLAASEDTTPSTVSSRPIPEWVFCDWPNGASEGFRFPSGVCANQYYQCSQGEPQIQNCPPGLVFGSSSEGCDLPSHVPSCCAGQARC